MQGFGVVDGRGWYFRARWEEWGFKVYDAPLLMDQWGYERLPDSGPEWSVYGESDGDASWMPFSEAWGHIETSIAAWRSR